MTDSRQFAKDVARQLAKRQRRRKWMTLGAVAGLIALAVVYLRCGRGWGIGGDGSGSGSGSGLAVVSGADAGARRCAIRVTATGIAVDGKPTTKDEAVAACRDKAGADVVVTGDARQGDWDDLRAALEAAHVEVFVRGS